MEIKKPVVESEMSIEEIGKVIGLTCGSTLWIERKAMNKFRKALAEKKINYKDLLP